MKNTDQQLAISAHGLAEYRGVRLPKRIKPLEAKLAIAYLGRIRNGGSIQTRDGQVVVHFGTEA